MNIFGCIGFGYMVVNPLLLNGKRSRLIFFDTLEQLNQFASHQMHSKVPMTPHLVMSASLKAPQLSLSTGRPIILRV